MAEYRMNINIEKLKQIPLFERAVIIAVTYHAGVVDKGNNPYILHPLNVAFSLDTKNEKIVGVLHNIIEDTELTFNDLRKFGFPMYIIEAIDSVTRRESETYMEFISRSKLNSIGAKVKLADIENNLDITRILNPTEKDYKRLERYKKAKKILLED